MKKSDLIAKVVDIADLSHRQADDVVSAFVEQVSNALSRGEAVNLTGFGAFQVRERAARTGRNPSTGQTMAIAGRNLPVFRAGKALREAVLEAGN